MSIFQDVTLHYNDNEYIVKKENVLMLIAQIESKITIQDLAVESPSMAKVSMGYAEALNYAGCKVTAEEIYASLFEDVNAAKIASEAVTGLLALMLPPEKLQRFQPKKKTANKKNQVAKD